MPRYYVTVNMGFCGADHCDWIEADSPEEACHIAEAEAIANVSSEAEEICEECEEPISDCMCKSL